MVFSFYDFAELCFLWFFFLQWLLLFLRNLSHRSPFKSCWRKQTLSFKRRSSLFFISQVILLASVVRSDGLNIDMSILLFEYFCTLFKFHFVLFVVIFHNSLERCCALNNVMKACDPHLSLFLWSCAQRKLPFYRDQKERVLPVLRKTYFKHLYVGRKAIDNWSKRYYLVLLIEFLWQSRADRRFLIMLYINLSRLKINFEVSLRERTHKHASFREFL